MLKLENINITFNKNTANERKALQHIDLDVADGDFVTVIGSNGAGKSTLMNVISGSYEADTGKIFLDGKNITHLKEHHRMGVAIDCNIQRVSVMFSAAGQAPRFLHPFFKIIARFNLWFKHLFQK